MLTRILIFVSLLAIAEQAVAKPEIVAWHEGQWMSNHHLRVVTEAAKQHISVIAHEPIKDTGLRRTDPNWLAREAARGMKYNAAAPGKKKPDTLLRCVGFIGFETALLTSHQVI